MERTKKIKNKYLWRRLLLLVFFLIFLTFLLKTVRGRDFSSYRTVFPTLTTYENDIDTQVYNIFHEKVYYSKGNGIAVFNASEGQKVPVDYEIANVNLMNDVSSLKDELQKIKSAIEYKKNGKQKETQSKKIAFDDTIQMAIRDRNFESAINGINNLDIDSNTNVHLSDIKDFVKLSMEELEAKQKDLEDKISLSNVSYKAEFSGIVSYKIDGLEKAYSLDNIKEYTYDYLQEHSHMTNIDINTEVKENEALFKEIDNLSWNAALSINDYEKIKELHIGDSITLEVLNNQPLKGNIIAINRTANQGVIVASFNTMLADMYSKRIHEGKIIMERQKGYEIPKSAILSRDNITGVYVQEIKGLVKFVPIEILHENEHSYFISRGDRQGKIALGEKSYRTLTINDAIVINPKTVEDSSVLN